MGYRYLRNVLKVDPSNIVAYGRSLGSGPTVDLVSKHPEIKGMVLQSPLDSGIRAFMGHIPSVALWGIDIFPNYTKLDKIKCPSLVIHGKADSVVPIRCGEAVNKALRDGG